MENSTIYERIREMCIEREITIKGLEKELGLAAASIGKWRNGLNPSVGSLLKIADFFGCSVDYLLGRTPIRELADSVLDDEDFKEVLHIRRMLGADYFRKIIGVIELTQELGDVYKKSMNIINEAEKSGAMSLKPGKRNYTIIESTSDSETIAYKSKRGFTISK